MTIAVLANNCSDGTAEVVRRYAADGCSGADAPRVLVREIRFKPEESHAGHARRAALDWASDLLADAPHGLICTTDADSRVYPDWIAQTWAEHGRGVEAVAGTVEFDEAEDVPLVLPEARRQEARYSTLQAELMAAIDPQLHDPWPNHIWAWGASLAMTRAAYVAVGGAPRVPLAEDRALVALLGERDFKVRHSLDVRVRTSSRTAGRAPGGLADLVAAYRDGRDFPCDAELQPVAVIEARARCRRLLAAVYGQLADADTAERLGVTPDCLALALTQRHFGEAWAVIDRETTCYTHSRVWPADLPAEIRKATALLDRLKRGRAADRSGNARAATAGLWTERAAQPL